MVTKLKVLRLTQQIRQTDDTAFADILMQAGIGKLPTDRPLPFASTADIDAENNFLWRWPSTLDKSHVDLNRILICSTNKLVNKHNQRELDAFPGSEGVFRSATKSESIR